MYIIFACQDGNMVLILKRKLYILAYGAEKV